MSDPKVTMVKAGTAEKNALMRAQHVSTRRHAHDQIYAARDYVLAQGKDMADYAIVVIDSDDPWMDAKTYEKLNGYGFSVQINARAELHRALKNFTMPVERAGLLWEPSAQAWVDDRGRAVTDFAKRKPYLAVASTVLEPSGDEHFLVVTFTRNMVEFCDVLNEKPPLEPEGPIVPAEAAAEEAAPETPTP